MRVQRNSIEKIELVKSIVDGRSYYTARLFDDFKMLPYMAMAGEDKKKDPMVAYDCEMVITQSELEFTDDIQAMYFYETNFSEQFHIAKYIEEYRRKLDMSAEAKQLLDTFDYVPIKMLEAALKVMKSLYADAQKGKAVTFGDFLNSFMPTLLAIEDDKGGAFLENRDRQRAIASGSVLPEELE